MADQQSDTGWYLKQVDETEEFGPFSGMDLMNYVAAGTINSKTLAKHAVNTHGEWVYASRIPNLEEAMQTVKAGNPVSQLRQLGNTKLTLMHVGLIAVGAIVLLCGGLGSFFTSNIREQTPEQKAASDMAWDELGYSQQAEREFKRVVDAVLKTPTVAKYNLTTQVTRGERGRVLFVDGTVTSQNSFGAMLTMPASGIFWRGNGESANQLAYANLDGETLPVGNPQILSWCKQLLQNQTGKKIVK